MRVRGCGCKRVDGDEKGGVVVREWRWRREGEG